MKSKIHKMRNDGIEKLSRRKSNKIKAPSIVHTTIHVDIELIFVCRTRVQGMWMDRVKNEEIVK